MRLCATIKGDTGKSVQKTSNQSLAIDLTVNRKPVGSIWIDYKEDGEWIVMFNPLGSEDGNIIAQG